MKVLDPGHRYELDVLDGTESVVLQFVKREGPGYPGNVGHYGGTIMQEVLRALVDRSQYVNQQVPCPETEAAIGLLKTAIVLFEIRAAKRHDRDLEQSVDEIVAGPTCSYCLHVGCDQHAELAR